MKGRNPAWLYATSVPFPMWSRPMSRTLEYGPKNLAASNEGWRSQLGFPSVSSYCRSNERAEMAHHSTTTAVTARRTAARFPNNTDRVCASRSAASGSNGTKKRNPNIQSPTTAT